MLNILCLDNNSEDVKMIERYLKNAFDYELLHVRTENEFKSALLNFKPDLILSDYSLTGGFTGLKALQIRNKEFPLIPFIVVTQSVNIEQAAVLIKNGASDLITKARLDRLAKTITNELKQALRKKEALKEEDILRKKEALFATFVENDISGVYMEKGDKVVYANRRLLDILGFDNVEQLNRYGPANLYLNRNDRERLLRELNEKGKVTDFAITIRNKKGNVLYVLENAFGQKGITGEIETVYGYIYDITKLKEAEAKREESEQLFKSISEHTNAGIIIYDNKKIVYANRQVSKIFGYSVKELLRKKNWEELFHPDYRDFAFKNTLLRLKGQAANVEYEYKIITKNKKIKWIVVSGNKFVYQGKNAALITVYDVTNKRLAEEKLKVQARRNNTLLRILEHQAHDLKKFTDFALHQILDFIEARTGYIYAYDENTETLELISLSEKEKPNKVLNTKDRYALKETGLWGEVIRQRKPVLVNNYSPERHTGKDYPGEDGIKLNNFLSIPLFDEHKIVAVAGVANKESGFNEEDIDDLRLIMDAVWKEVNNIKANKATSEREKNFKDIVENTPNGVVISDAEGKIVYANDFFCKLSRYTLTELLKLKNYEPLLLPQEREIYTKQTKKILKGKTRQKKYNFTLLTKNGEKVPTEYFFTTTVWHEEEMLLTLATDLTERKKAEEIASMLQFAFEQIPVSIVATDINGDIEYVNPFFKKLTGYSAEEVLGQNPRILQSGKTPREIYPVLWDTILSGKPWEGEFINRKKNGKEYVERALIAPIKSSNGEIIRFLAIKEDITLKKRYIQGLIRAKEKAETAERLKTNFLANVSHELRTPLNGIIGFSDLMETEESPEVLKSMVGYIKTSSLRLLNTLNLIIDFSILNSENITVHKSAFDLIKTLETIKSNFSELAKAKGLFLFFEPGVPSLEIVFDKSILEKTIGNLVDNAIKFTPKGGVSIELDTSLFEELGMIKINVRDTGIGIPKKYQKVIFEPFRQVSEGYGRNYEGMGLGLSVSNKYIQTVGGKISVSSIPGKGSVFTVTFTAEKPDDVKTIEESTRKTVPLIEKKPVSILFVKDNPASGELIEQLLSDKYNFITVDGFNKGADLIQSEKFSLIIVDTAQTGSKAESHFLKETEKSTLNNNTPKIAIRTVGDSNTENAEKPARYDALLFKPLKNEELLKTVERLIKK